MITDPNCLISFDLKINKLVVTFPYDMGMISRIRNVPYAHYNSVDKKWEIRPEFLNVLLDNFPSFPKTAFVEKLWKDYLQNEQSAQKELDDIIAHTDLDLPINGVPLFEHQKTAIKFLLKEKRSILADEMGLGKTRTSLIAMNITKAPIYVIAPISLFANWKKEAAMAGVEIKELIPWSNIPDPSLEPGYALIVDEAHYGQNLKSDRTQKFLHYAGPAKYLVLISGTPIKNGRPSNLFPLLMAIKHPLSYNKTHYEQYYCSAIRTKFHKWNIGGAAHLQDLFHAIGNKLIRRTKKECLDLPEKLRVLRLVELDADGKALYDNIFHMLKESYHRRIKERKITGNNEALVMLTQLRHAASWGKIFEIREMAEEIIEEGNKVVVFAAFKDSAIAMQDELAKLGPCGLISSEVSQADRDIIVEAFQRGELNSVVCTYGAGGVGINLTKASNVILMDRPWTPSEAEQAEDRCHRIGTTEKVTAYWIQAHNLDIQIDQLLLEKQKNISEVLTGKRDSLEYGMEDVRNHASEIVKELFA